MTTMTHKTDLVEEAKGRLIEQFRGRTNIEAVIGALAQQSQELEDAAFEVLTETTIANAVGIQLDSLGSLIGVERGGSLDAEYRLKLQAQVLANTSDGTINELLGVLDALGATSIVLTENYPAKVEIVIDDPFTLGDVAGEMVNKARAAAVGLDLTWHETATPFTLDTAGLGLDQGDLVGHLHY